jgi:hypothetical protein
MSEDDVHPIIILLLFTKARLRVIPIFNFQAAQAQSIMNEELLSGQQCIRKVCQKHSFSIVGYYNDFLAMTFAYQRPNLSDLVVTKIYGSHPRLESTRHLRNGRTALA